MKTLIEEKVTNPGDPGQQITDTQAMIAEECDRIKQILLDKNRKYGDSAIHPARIFSRADPVEQINVRLDDKLSRIRSGQSDDDEDVDLDLIGYLVLRRIARRVHGPVRAAAILFAEEIK